jgi:protein TonB
MGLLAKSSQGNSFTQRSGALAAVVGLHLVALVVAVNARTREERPIEGTIIQMAFLQEEPAPPEPVPQLAPPSLEQMAPPEIVAPQVLIPVIDIADSRAITAAPPAPPPPPAAAPLVARTAEPVLLSEEQVEYVREPDPQYPRAAKLAKLQGKVLVWVLIDTDGRPREVRVHRSSGHEQLDRAGCDAASRALFKPYRQDGVSRSAHVIIPIEFRIGAVRTASRH